MLLAALALVASLMVVAPADGARRPAGRWPICGEWRRVRLPRGGEGSVVDVAVVSPSEAWAISDHGYESWNESHVYRWTGLRWSEVPFPIAPSPDRYWVLGAIESVTANEIWVVGHEFLDSGRSRAISARWDGDRWRLVRVGQRARGLALDGLAVTPGTHRLWAVGAVNRAPNGSTQSPLVLRWSGRAWHRVDTPTPGRTSAFADVVTVRDTAWAVGYVRRRGGADHVLASRWTGDRWTVRWGPRGRAAAVDGLGADELWAVGATSGRSGYGRAIVVRWNGSSWSLALRFERISDLRDLVVASGSDAWAVGQQDRHAHPFIVRRHGGPWSIAPAPRFGWLTAIDGTPSNLWTFRTHFPGGEPSEVVEFDTYHRC